MDKGKGTVADFRVDAAEAADGRHSALVSIGEVGDWGSQFGQSLDGGRRGKTYTFAVFVKAVGGPVTVRLEIERAANPYDRAARSEPQTVTPDKWQELRVTFTAEKDFAEGWFAYVSCNQPGAKYRCDMFRLYEGPYVPREVGERQGPADAAVRLYDTGMAAARPLPPEALAARNWRPVPAGQSGYVFAGDAVLANDRLTVVLRRQRAGAEVYSAAPSAGGGQAAAGLPGQAGAGRAAGGTLRAVLSPAGAPLREGGGSEGAKGARAERMASVKIAGQEGGAVALEAAFAAGGGPASVIYRLGMGQAFVETEPRGGTAALAIEAPCRFTVLPDFFADDIVIDASEWPAAVAEAELPADHFLLHLAPDGGGIVMAVWNPAADVVGAAFTGTGQERRLVRSVVPYGKGGKVWVACLEGSAIWHAHPVAAADAGKVAAIDWRQPFPAQWRLDWRRKDGLTDSWEMVTEGQDGRFTKVGLFGEAQTLPADRKRWTTVLGNFAYPCWIDRGGRGHVQPLRSKVLAFEGPAVLYPISRARTTPLEAFTVVDVVRATLGVGPCEYVLDVEGQRSQYKGRATCANRDFLNPIFEKGEQRRRRAEVEQSLKEVMVFVRHIRDRVEQYVAFGRWTLEHLAQQKKAHPHLAAQIQELERLAREIDARVAARRDKIKTPDEAQRMVDEFRATVLDNTGPDAPAKCKSFTAAVVEIGGNQDELVGECRWAVKVVRQRAGLLAAVDPRMAEVVAEIRRRSQQVLRNPAGHEGAQH